MSRAATTVAAVSWVARTGRGMAFLLALVVACVSFDAVAKGIDGPKKAALKTTADRLIAAVLKEDFDTVVDISMPPPVLALAAAAYREPVAAYRAGLIRAWRGDAASRAGGLRDLAIDTDRAADGRLANGTAYAVLPFRYTHVGASARRRVDDWALAILDGNTWYVVLHARRLERRILDQAYPGLAAIELPREKIEELKQ